MSGLHHQTSGTAGLARRALALVAVLALTLAPAAQADRTKLKPGWNLFSPQQDVQIGRSNAQQAEQQLPIVRDSQITNYLNNLGRKLAGYAPGDKFPYQFKMVNDRGINAFCLPGGFVYVNRGVVEAADNEAQLAGVMAHEISHAALRHGTNQATKAYATQAGLGILGSIVGGGSVGSLATQLGASFGANSVLLKFSRDAERQADTMGTQILYDAGYDPRAMAQFFEKLEAERKGGRTPQFFSSHPSPENRVERVNEEIDRLGGTPRNYRSDSPDFQTIKRRVAALPAPPKGGQGGSASPGGGSYQKPPAPSRRLIGFNNDLVSLQYPDNWRAADRGSSATLAPQNGVFQDQRGAEQVAYGVIFSEFDLQDNGRHTLEEATSALISSFQRNEPDMRVSRQSQRARLDGYPALSTYLSNASVLGGRETIWLVTVAVGERTYYFACVAPEGDFDQYEAAFQSVLDSVRFR